MKSITLYPKDTIYWYPLLIPGSYGFINSTYILKSLNRNSGYLSRMRVVSNVYILRRLSILNAYSASIIKEFYTGIKFAVIMMNLYPLKEKISVY